MAPQFIYTTYKLARYYPPDRTVLENISLSFYPGAKIGVLGANGAGKSSLLRIMAGLDDGFTGEARLTSGFSVGFLAQEPHLDAARREGNVMEGGVPVKAIIDRTRVLRCVDRRRFDKVGAYRPTRRQITPRAWTRAQRRSDGRAALPSGDAESQHFRRWRGGGALSEPCGRRISCSRRATTPRPNGRVVELFLQDTRARRGDPHDRYSSTMFAR